MYAFLSKVFGRKKDDRDASSSSQPVLGPGELLGGRFEAVSANVSPSSQCLELDPDINEAKDKEKEKDKEVGFTFFKGKWRPASPDVRPTRKLDMLPHLSLNFQEPKAEPATPFLLFTTDQILSDTDIGQRRLNPSEALILVQACSRAIVARGLETLGVMHPHWYAASHKIQRRVISHFIYLLNLENATTSPSLASPTSPLSAFEGEVNDTFSLHDIAAILRWGLRHVQIEGNSFGTDDAWYKTFLESEGAAGYPPKAFSDKLAPLLPTAHLQLLTATLEIFSSLAAHAEVNGTSGSKLCKLFGLWLLTAHRVEDNDDWKTFYARWDRTGRMLEHLFLSRIRDQSTDHRMPIRLLELIHKYPYNLGLSSPTTDLSLLPHPPFTTRLYDALFVRIEIELPYGKRKPSSKLPPLSLLADAFSTKVEGEYADLWAKITTASKNGDSSFLTNIFTDDTISYLSFVPDESSGHEVKSPTFDLASSSASPHKHSYSVDDADKPAAFVHEHPKSASELPSMSPLSPLSNGIGSDWAQFSTSGFLEVNPNIVPLASTLFDTDIEKTTPPEAVTPLSRKSSKRSKAASPSSPRKSFDLHRPTSPEIKLEGAEEQKNIIRASQPRIIQLDEAFIDFWSDSLLDPISADWPTFIICKFKSSLVPELTFEVAQEAQKQKTIQWLLLEQVYTIRTPPIAPIVVVRPRPTSPISPSPSLKQRFSFWSVSRSASNSSATSQKGKKKEQELRVGEMGELVEEQPKTEGKELTVRAKSPIFRTRRSLDIAPKSTEAKRKSAIIKPAEEAKIDEETTAVAAVATGIVVASAAVVITNGLSTTQPNLVEAASKSKEDRSADTPVIEAVSTRSAVTVPEPTVKQDDIPLSTTVGPDVVSSLEAKVETVPLESDSLVVEGTAIEPGVIVGEETEDRIEIEPSLATQAVPSSETDVAPITTEAITEAGETVGVLEQQEPIVAPLVSEVATIPEPEIVKEAPAEHDFTSTAEEAPAVSTSEPETSFTIERTPAHHSLLAESGSPDDENAVNQSETIDPRATEAEHTFSPTEDKTDVADAKTSDSPPIFAATGELPEVASQEIIQLQSTEVLLVTKDVPDNREINAPSTKLEGHGTAENIEAKGFVVKEAKHDFDPVVPVLPDVNNPEHEVETEATVEPPLLTSTEQELPATLEQKPELGLAHSDEPAGVAAESSSKAVLDADATGGIELQSELEQETLIPPAQEKEETLVDAVSSTNDAPTAHEVEADAHVMGAAPTTNDLVAKELPETKQPVVPTTEGDSTKHVIEAAIVAVGLASAEGFSSMDKTVPEGIHEATFEAGNESVESGTALNIEPQREHEVDVTAPEAEDTPDINSSLHNDPTPVPLSLEPESGLIETELVTERQVETTSTATAESVPVDVEVQPENAPIAQKDIEEVQTRVDDTSNIKDEPIPESDVAQHIEAADTVLEGHPEEVLPSSTEESNNTVQLEPEVEFIAPAEEGPSAITQEAAESLPPKIESEEDISQAPVETIPAPEDVTASVANVEDHVIAPVDVQSEHGVVVETTSTDELVEVNLPPDVVESPEVLTPLVEPSYKSSDDEIVGSHVVPEEDVHVPETQIIGEAALVSIMAAASVESDFGQGVAENVPVSSQEPPVNPEPQPEEPATHEEAVPIPSTSLEIPEVDAPVTVETEPEYPSTNPTSEDKVSTLEVEERHDLLSPENPEAVNKELNDGSIPLAAAEPGPEVAEAVVAPVLGTFELQAQNSVEETTEGHIVEAAREAEFIVPDEGGSRSAIEELSASQLESTVEPVKAPLEIPEAEESDLTAEVEPQIIPAIVEESPAQIEEDKPVLAALQDDITPSKAPLDTQLVPEDAAVVESEPDASHMDSIISVVPTPAIAVAAQAPDVQEDATVIPEADNYEIKTEGSSPTEEKVAVQDHSPSKSFVDTEVQPEAQVLEETFNTDKADSGAAAAIILPEALQSTGPIVDPLTSEIAISEPETEKEAPAERDLGLVAEESPAVSTSEPETYTIEVIPATAIDHSFLTESGVHDDENAVNQSETMELQSELEPRVTEAKHIFSPAEESDSDPILAAAQQLPEDASQEIIQPQSTAVSVTGNDLDSGENQVEITTSSTKLEGYGTAENIEAEKEYVVKEAKHDSDPVPVFPDVNNLEHEVETEVTVEPPLPTSIEQDSPTTIKQELELDTAHSEEPAGLAVEGSSKVVLDADATGDIELRSELEQETLIPSAQETGVDVVSSSNDALTAVVAHEVETEVEDETQAATATNDLTSAELPETEQPVVPTTEGDSTKHLNEAVIVAVGLAAAEGFSSMDKVVPEVTHEATPEGGNDFAESGTALNEELQRGHEVDDTAPETEDTHPDIDSSLRNDPTPVLSSLEPESSLIETELVAERQVETTSTTTTNSVPIDAEVQPEPSLSEAAPNAEKDIEEVQTQVDDTSNIKGESIPESDIVQHVEAADANLEGPLEDVPASSTKESQSTVQLEAEVDLDAPAEEESSTIAQADLFPKIESEATPIPEDVTASIANVEDQIIAPLDVQSEHAAVIKTSSTDKPAETILPPNVEESPETLTPLVEPSYKSSDDEIVGRDIVPEDTQVLGEAAVASIMTALAVESDLGPGVAENVSVPSQEPPVNSEPEEPATHEEAVPISSSSLEVLEVNVPITAETEPESHSTNSISEDNVSTLEVEERHVLLSPEGRDPANIELNDGSIALAAAEPGPEVVEAVVEPVLGTFESQAQHSVEETTEEVRIVEAASESEFSPNEESTIDPVKTQLGITEARVSDRTTEVEPQIIPAIMEESPAQIEEDRPVLAVLQDDTTLSQTVHAEPLDTELVPEHPAMAVESEPDALHEDTSIPVVPTPATDGDTTSTAQVQEDQLDTTVLPEAEPDLPGHEIKTEGLSSFKEEEAVQDSSPSKSFVDTEVQPEAQELEETFNTDKANSGAAAANILPEALPSTQELIVDHLASEIAISEPEIEEEAPADLDLESTAEESPVLSTSEPGTSYATEVIPASVDHSILTESGSPDDENAVNQSETMGLQSELEPKATETEHIFPPVEDVSDGKTSNSAPVLTVTQQLPEVASQEIIQPQSTLVTENVLDNGENQVETGVIVGEETEDRIEIETSLATQAAPSSETDVAPITPEAITEVGETVGVLEQQEPIVAPLVSEVATIPEPEVVKEAPAEHDLTSTAEEAPAVSTSEPETSYAIEGTPAHHSLLAESGSPDDENAVNQSETIEPRASEAEHAFSPTEDKTDVADAKTSDSPPIFAATGELPEVASQEIIQPQSTEVLATEDVLDDREINASSTKASSTKEGHGTAENIEAKDFVAKEAKRDFDPVVPVLPGVNNLENEIETEATVEPPLLTSTEQDLPTTLEQKPELGTAHSDEPAGIAAESSSKVVLDADATGGIELQSELEQETLIPPAQEKEETLVDAVSSTNDAPVAHEVETEVEADTHEMGAATTTNDLAATELPETKQPVVPTTEGGSTKHVIEAAIEAVGLTSAESFSSTDKAVPEGIHEATFEAGNDSVESGTTLNIEPQREHEVDDTAPEAEDTPDIHSSLHNDPTPVPLSLEHESGLIETELVTERQVETTSLASTNGDFDDQPDTSSSETAPNAQKDIEVQTQVDDTSDIEDEPIPKSDIAQHIEAVGTESALGDVPASSPKESQKTVQLEPEVDFVAPTEEEPSAITEVATDDLLPKIEGEGAVSQTLGEIISIPEDTTAPVANVEDQIIAPADIRSEHAAVVEKSSTDELALPPNVEESPENLTPLVEPSYKSSDVEIVGKSHAVPEEDVHAPETQVLGEAALVSIMAAASVESGLEQTVAENVSVPSQELPVNPELEESVTHEEADPIPSTSLEIPEVDAPVTVETEPKLPSTNSTSEDKVSTLEVEERHVLLSSENPDVANVELNDDSIPSLEETTEEGHIVETASEAEFIVPNEESTVEPVKVQLEIPESGESERTAEVEPQVIQAIMDESPAQVQEGNPVLAALQDDTTPSQTESLDTDLVPEGPATVIESEPDALHIPVVPTPTIAVAAQAPEGQEDRLDSTVIPEAESDLPIHEIEVEAFSSIEEGDADPDSLPSEAGESDRIAEVEPQIIPAIMEESPAQIEEDRPNLSALQDDNIPFEAVHAETLDAELIPVEDPAMVVDSEPDASLMDTSIPVVPIDSSAIAVAAQAQEVQEDRLNTAVIQEAESDLPTHEIKAEGSSIEEGDAVQDYSPSKSFVDTEVQPEAEVLEETFNTDKADSGVANILPEAVPSTLVDDTSDLLTSSSSTSAAGEFVGEIPVATNVISEESAVSAPE